MVFPAFKTLSTAAAPAAVACPGSILRRQLLLFWLLPKAPVRWCDAFHGALLTAAAWEIGRQVLAIFIARGKYTSAYGVVGAFLAILLWCYYAVTIILLGAEYIHVVRARKRKARATHR